jgi:hypothetical protein
MSWPTEINAEEARRLDTGSAAIRDLSPGLLGKFMNRTAVRVVMQAAIFSGPLLMLSVPGSLSGAFFIMVLVSIFVLVREALR